MELAIKSKFQLSKTKWGGAEGPRVLFSMKLITDDFEYALPDLINDAY